MAAAPSGAEAWIAPVTNVSDFIWGGTWNGEALSWLSINGQPIPPMTLILLGIGMYIMFGLRFYPIIKLGSAFKGLFSSRKSEGSGEISPFAALSTALSGQVGTGNLAGVATAIALGGPGAIFWMWVTALVGMALAFAEGSLAIRYREKTSDGVYRGGPMTYIMMGLGKKWTWLAIVFCLGTLFSALVTGNSIQANAIADGMNELFGIEEWIGGTRYRDPRLHRYYRRHQIDRQRGRKGNPLHGRGICNHGSDRVDPELWRFARNLCADF